MNNHRSSPCSGTAERGGGCKTGKRVLRPMALTKRSHADVCRIIAKSSTCHQRRSMVKRCSMYRSRSCYTKIATPIRNMTQIPTRTSASATSAHAMSVARQPPLRQSLSQVGGRSPPFQTFHTLACGRSSARSSARGSVSSAAPASSASATSAHDVSAARHPPLQQSLSQVGGRAGVWGLWFRVGWCRWGPCGS